LAPDLWRRFTITPRRPIRVAEVASVQYAKVAEY
jgi:hypothetical protein